MLPPERGSQTDPYHELRIPYPQVESSFNVLEIRAFNTLSQNQVSTRAWAPLSGQQEEGVSM